MSKNHHRLIILGSGPAGVTAAIYAARSRIEPLVIAGSRYGGQLMLTGEIENFPGFDEAIQGPELMEKKIRQAKKFGAQFIFEDVTRVDFSKKPFQIFVGDKNFEADAIIIATGASALKLGIEGEKRLSGRGVAYCAPCDAPLFKDKKAIVMGGGDAAMEEALYLSKFAQSVTVIHRRNKLRASKIMQEKAFANSKIKFIFNTTVEEILGENNVEEARVKDVKSGKEKKLACDAVFVAIGHKPNTEIFNGQIKLDKKGYIMMYDSTKTSKKGIFVAGDVHDWRYRQAVTAAGFGCMAAMDAQKYLEEGL